MRSMRVLVAAGVLMACVAGNLGVARAAGGAKVARSADAPRAAKPAGTRQFTGWVTAFDNTSLTVERRGKQPKTVVFTKHSEMKTQGDVEKDARVTVYYRDEGGQLTAHRVVVKAAATRDAAARPAGGARGRH